MSAGQKAGLNETWSATRRRVKSASRDSAKRYVINAGFYPEKWVLPAVFKVTNLHKASFPFNYTDKSEYRPIAEPKILRFPKTALAWQEIHILDPRSHYVVSQFIFDNWTRFREGLTRTGIVKSTSIPHFRGDRSENSINAYLQFAETDIVIDSKDYECLLITDIKNFYPSVYTHSLSWIVESKPVAKSIQNRFDMTLCGNQLDKIVQHSMDGQTNGLPIGPMTSDIISEIMLTSIDYELAQKLGNVGAIGGRFKDDYRILCKDRATAQKVIEAIRDVLSVYNLKLNEEKTSITDNPIKESYRKWKKELQELLPESLLDGSGTLIELPSSKIDLLMLHALELHKKYPTSGVLNYVAILLKRVGLKHDNPANRHKYIAQLFKLTDLSPRALPLILGVLEGMFKGKPEANYIAKQLLKSATDRKDVFRALWAIYFANKVGYKIRNHKRMLTELQPSPSASMLPFAEILLKMNTNPAYKTDGIDLFYDTTNPAHQPIIQELKAKKVSFVEKDKPNRPLLSEVKLFRYHSS